MGKKIVPCLWFDHEAEEAAKYYTSIFKNSKIVKTTYYGEAGQDVHGQKPGTVLTVAFELDGQPFTALNGGPVFKFNEALSLQVMCDDQKEIDDYWEKLSMGGDSNAQQCGWLKDKYGLSWQVVPKKMVEWFGEPNEKSERAMSALLSMGKLDITALERAYAGR